MKKISFIGLSGSGKTYIVERLISLLDKQFGLKSAVVKNIHKHQMDTEGKDTYRYGEAGAKLSITKNVPGETTIFIKNYLEMEKLMNWIEKGPFSIDIFIAEGFRDLKVPTVLCARDTEKIEDQITETTKAISGLIAEEERENYKGLPVINIERNPKPFLKLLDLRD
ncbi:MAG: molybdopterin-guanine dinucleotide biosynthesis protein B [archaeon]